MKLRLKSNLVNAHISAQYGRTWAEKVSNATRTKEQREFIDMLSKIEGLTIDVDTKYLFENQFNTVPIAGVSENGLRLMDYHVEAVIDDIRYTVGKCGYCGKHYPGTVDGFCSECMGNAYLQPNDLHLLRILPASTPFNVKREPLTETESAELLPRYTEAQNKSKTVRSIAYLAELREKELATHAKSIETADNRLGGFLWLIDRGYNCENVIFYDHIDTFCFGWREELSQVAKDGFRALLADFPYQWEFKNEPGKTNPQSETAIRDENATLYQSMLDKGYRFTVTKDKAHFVDSEGSYIAFPIGYITGPNYTTESYHRHWYASVNGRNGWHQKQFETKTAAINWAVETARKIKSEQH